MTVFEIACVLEYAVQGPTDFVFNVQTVNTAQQCIQSEALWIAGTPAHTEHIEPLFRSRLVRTRATEGAVTLNYAATLSVLHMASDPARLDEVPVAELPVETLQFLSPSRYCPSDRMYEVAVREFGRLRPGHARVEAVCAWVHDRMRFVPGTTDWTTSAVEALAQGAGVCRDFAHVTISLLRALNVPARFVTGYDYGVDPCYGPTDFHAYVEAWLGDRWWIFDATRLAPRTGLVRIGMGRDAADCAFATLFGPTRFVRMQLDIRPLNGPVNDDQSLAISTAGLDDGLRWRAPVPRERPCLVAA